MNPSRTVLSPPSQFALFAAVLAAAALWLPSAGLATADDSTRGVATLLAFTVELPLVFWFLVLRPRGSHPVYAVPVAAAGFAICRLWLPAGESAWVAWAWVALLPLEAWLIAVLVHRAMRVARTARDLPRSLDLIGRLLRAAELEFPGNRAVGLLAFEVGVVWYALGGKPAIELEPYDVAFTYHRRSGMRMVFVGAMVLGMFEIVGVHLLVAAKSPTAAWILSGIEIYGVVWVVGLVRSVAHLPVVLGERGVHVRLGVIHDLFVPYEEIESVRRERMHLVETKRTNYLNCAFMSAPDFVVKLRAPRQARLPYTRARMVDEIGVMVDAPKEFMVEIERRMVRAR